MGRPKNKAPGVASKRPARKSPSRGTAAKGAGKLAEPRARSNEVAPDEGTRERRVAGAARLLAERGLQATSFSEVLEFTSSPRGSIYHHFPEGKEQLVRAALALVTGRMRMAFAPRPEATSEDVAKLFLGLWRELLRRSNFKAGCAVVAVTIAADSAVLVEDVGKIFRSWRASLTTEFTRRGVKPSDAASFAALLIAASEGAVVLSRAEQSMEPFDLVAAQLLAQVRAL